MAKRDKEIREVLRGRTKLLEDGRFASLGPDDYVIPTGISDGATAVRLLGVMRRARILETKLTDWKLKEVVRKAMQDSGRGLVLTGQPETLACFMRYVLTRPALLTFVVKDDLPIVTAYTGRGLTGFISMARALKTFQKNLPDTVTFSDTPAPNEVKLEKEKKKQEKKKKKQEKAEKKAEKKAARKKEEDKPAAEPEKEAAETGETAAAAGNDTSEEKKQEEESV